LQREARVVRRKVSRKLHPSLVRGGMQQENFQKTGILQMGASYKKKLKRKEGGILPGAARNQKAEKKNL